MNFLELCKRTVEKCGISGSLSATSGQTGEMLRVVNWVGEAWHDIQLSNSNWDWMRYEFSFSTVTAQQEYTPDQANATLFGKWHTGTFRIFQSGPADEQFLTEQLYLPFRDTYIFGVPKQSRPAVFAVRPRGSSLLLGDTPDGVYTVYGEYQRRPYYLVNPADIPDMPEEYHMAIVHAARMKYAAYENAPEVMAEAGRDFERIMGGLAVTQLDDIGTGAPLA